VFQLIFFLSVAAILLIFLIALARRGKAEGAGRVLVGAHRAVFTLETELLANRIVNRIFSREDMDYVLSAESPQAVSILRKERKRIAILWVDRVRGQIRQLQALHLGSARFYARLDVRTELSLACDFALLMLGCRALHIVFAVAGPYATPRLVTNVAEAATRVCFVSRQSLAFLGPGLKTLGGPSSGTPPQLNA
jgi:hypothetical protein